MRSATSCGWPSGWAASSGGHRQVRRVSSPAVRSSAARDQRSLSGRPCARRAGQRIRRAQPGLPAGWRDHNVRPIATLRKYLHHPELGRLDLDCQTLLLPGTDLRLVMYTAEPGSPSAAALARLATCGV